MRRPPAVWETSRLGDDHEIMHYFFKLWVGANGRHLYKVTLLASLFRATRCELILFLVLFSFRRFFFFSRAMMERLPINCASKASGRGQFSQSSRCLNTLFFSPAVCFAFTSHLQPPWRLLLLVLLFRHPERHFLRMGKRRLIGYRIKRIKQGAPENLKSSISTAKGI